MSPPAVKNAHPALLQNPQGAPLQGNQPQGTPQDAVNPIQTSISQPAHGSLPVKPTAKPIDKTVAKQPTGPLREVHQGFKQFKQQLKQLHEPVKPHVDKPTVKYPFTYTPDVLIKNSAMQHPEEVDHALNLLLGPDYKRNEESDDDEFASPSPKKKNKHDAHETPTQHDVTAPPFSKPHFKAVPSAHPAMPSTGPLSKENAPPAAKTLTPPSPQPQEAANGEPTADATGSEPEGAEQNEALMAQLKALEAQAGGESPAGLPSPSAPESMPVPKDSQAPSKKQEVNPQSKLPATKSTPRPAPVQMPDLKNLALPDMPDLKNMPPELALKNMPPELAAMMESLAAAQGGESGAETPG